ncbi:MAG: hypothetical protein AB7O21_19575 [Gammaproteobacteria bacterium]
MSGWWDSIKEKLSKAGQALRRALEIAKASLKNPAVVAAVPQYALPALAVTELISRAQEKGKLPEIRKQLEDKTLKLLARELDEMDKGQRSAMSGGGICLACDSSLPARRSGNGARMRGARMRGNGTFPSTARPSPFGLDSDGSGPFGLPQGNPHPFAEMIRRQIAKGARDPIEMQKLAAMHDLQRRMARNSR